MNDNRLICMLVAFTFARGFAEQSSHFAKGKSRWWLFAFCVLFVQQLDCSFTDLRASYIR